MINVKWEAIQVARQEELWFPFVVIGFVVLAGAFIMAIWPGRRR